jgi:hypothetical protein
VTLFRIATAALAGAVLILAGGIRFLGDRFPNDHFLYLAAAQQMGAGEWPTRDFFDPGTPLMYGISLAARWISGTPLFGEVVLVSLSIGLAAALTLVMAARLSRSVLVGLVAALLETAIFPRSYNHPKMLLYAAGPVLMWSYVRRPSYPRLAAVAALVVAAFLIRHDHGLFLGAAAMLTVGLAPGLRLAERTRHAAGLALMCLVLLAPYGAFLAANGGVGEYVRAGLAFSRAEAERTELAWPAWVGGASLAETCGPLPAVERASCVLRANATPWLFYLFHALPLVALAVMLVAVARRRPVRDVALAAPIALTAIAVNVSFLRDSLPARLPDAIVPAVLMGAWLARAAWSAQRDLHATQPRPGVARWAWSTVVAAVLLMTTVAVAERGNTRDNLNRAGVLEPPRRYPEFFAQRTADASEPRPLTMSTGATINELMPFFAYLDRCAVPDDRLLVSGFAPEIFVFSGRLFAAGRSSFVTDINNTDPDQRRAIARLERQQAFVVLLTDWDSDWRRSFPLMAAHVDAGYELLAEIPIRGDRNARVLVARGRVSRRTDQATGWPCFTGPVP